MRIEHAGTFLCRMSVLSALAFVCALPAAAQAARDARAEVELPLSTYDTLRDQAQEKKPEVKEAPWGSARLLRGSLSVDLAARRATWEAQIAAVESGEQPPAVTLV